MAMPSFRLVLSGLALALACVACNDDPNAPPVDPPEEPSPPEPSDDFSPYFQKFIRYVRAYCATDIICPNGSSTAPLESIEACEFSNLFQYSRLGPWAYDGVELEIVEPALQQLETFLTTTCGRDSTDYDVWSRMVSWPFVGQIADNEPCTDSAQCASRGLCDALIPGEVPVCIPPTQELGMPCEHSRACIEGPGQRVLCAIKPGETTGVCATWNFPNPKSENESCGMDANGFAQPCKMGLWCDRGTCVQPKRHGELCGSVDSYGCVAGAYCKPTFQMNIGMCIQPLRLDEGAPCSNSGQVAEYCSFEQGLLCDPNAGRCVDAGFECFHDAECGKDGGICNDAWKCEPPRPDGGECWRDLNCASQHCLGADPNNGPGTCAPQ